MGLFFGFIELERIRMLFDKAFKTGVTTFADQTTTISVSLVLVAEHTRLNFIAADRINVPRLLNDGQFVNAA